MPVYYTTQYCEVVRAAIGELAHASAEPYQLARVELPVRVSTSERTGGLAPDRQLQGKPSREHSGPRVFEKSATGVAQDAYTEYLGAA